MQLMEMKQSRPGIIIPIFSQDSGSCWTCQKIKDNIKDKFWLIDGYKKYCNIKCFLKQYSNEELKVIWNGIIPNIKQPKTRSNAIKILSKEMEVRGW